MKSYPKLNRNLLILEINEVPWRIIDKFKSNPELPNIKKYFESAKTYTTVVEPASEISSDVELVKGLSREGKHVVIDSGELSPWVTWPTFHRGITNEEHGIKFLGQDIITFKGKSIWQEFLDLGLNIGVCGSLQSWPPIDPGDNGFYIPDTFAHDESCIPSYIKPFQRFNLSQVQKNGLVVRQKGLFSNELLPFLFSLPKLGIRFKTFLKIGNQLFTELLNKDQLAKRPVFQCILFWDIFKGLYNVKNPPALSTFFTNHVASVMHRYWHHVFPEDFGNLYKDLDPIHYKTMLFALKAVDNILFDAIDFCKENPEIIIVFSTSMGQDAIQYTSCDGYSAELEDVAKLFKIFGIKQDDYTLLLAMVPQVTVEVKDDEVKKHIRNCLNKCLSKSSKQLFTLEEAGDTLSIWVHTPLKEDVIFGGFTFDDKNSENKVMKWQEAGIIMHKLDVATAYHTREGILAIYGDEIAPNDSREKIGLSKCKSLLLDIAFANK